MVSSLSAWAPATKVACPLLRKASAGPAQLKWSEALEGEYQSLSSLIKNKLRLSPYDPSRWLNLCIDGSAIHGMGFLLFQWADEGKPSSGATIIAANSSLLPPNIGFSPIDGEIASLSYAIKCVYYYILHSPRLRLYSDCKGLVEMYSKDLTKVSNPKHFRIMTEIQCVTFHEVTYIYRVKRLF